MTNTEKPKIEFPCDYPIKIIGQADTDFKELVVEIVKQFDPMLDESRIELNPSSKGKFVSVRLVITATGEDQLNLLFKALKATGRVQMVL